MFRGGESKKSPHDLTSSGEGMKTIFTYLREILRDWNNEKRNELLFLRVGLEPATSCVQGLRSHYSSCTEKSPMVQTPAGAELYCFFRFSSYSKCLLGTFSAPRYCLNSYMFYYESKFTLKSSSNAVVIQPTQMSLASVKEDRIKSVLKVCALS